MIAADLEVILVIDLNERPMKTNLKKLALLAMLLLPMISNAQFVIPTGATFTISKGTDLIINTTGFTIAGGSIVNIEDNSSSKETNISVANAGTTINNNTSFDFSQTNLQLDLNGGTQVLGGNLVVRDLSLTSQGLKSITGNLTVVNSITFTEGILVPSSSGKILYTGTSDGLTEASDISYVEGAFYNGGPDGEKKFPIGANSQFAGAILTDGKGEVGMTVHGTSANLVFTDNPELLDVNTDRYWEILTDASQVNSRIGLSLNGLDAFVGTDAISVVQSDAVSGDAKNLSSTSSNGGLVLSRAKVSLPILTIGKEAVIKVTIHDLITPFTIDTKNDVLYIDHIDHFDFNTVTLLDRWGVEIKKWKDFTNYDDPLKPNADGYDFAKLSPGNYICIVEYGNKGGKREKISQMITVLKTN
jgi:hypothetical protein